MREVMAVAMLALALGTARAAERVVIDPMRYTGDTAVQASWKPQESSGPASLAPERAPDGSRAIAFGCDMAKQSQRAYWDHDAKLDLSRVGKVAFWIRAEGNLSAIASCNLYFRSGRGWYGANFNAPEKTWQKIVIDRGQYGTEDTPAGWSAIEGLRLAFWKGRDSRVTVYVGAMEATATDVVVVRNARAGAEPQPFVESMIAALQAAGIDAMTVDDADVETGVLAGKRIAIYPLNPQPSGKEMDALEAFARSGGHVLACFTLAPRMASLLGLRDDGYIQQQQAGQFAVMRALPQPKGSELVGMPAQMRQASWNITRVRPQAKGARVLAQWYDNAGKDTGYPAIVMSDTGAYISHVLLDDDPSNRDRLLRALLGRMDTGLWKEAATRSVQTMGAVLPRWSNYAEAEKEISADAATMRSTAAQSEIGKARQARDRAQKLLAAGDWPGAMEAAGRAREALATAYALAQPTKSGEFRAVWCHSAYGVSGMTWDAAIKRLKENGFTAVVPNMLWGGIADYKSSVLPVSPRVAKDGDQIAECLAACRKYGIKMHVWKVNWNLANAPEEFVAKMRAEHRLQADASGKEERWLCPSNPTNRELERQSLIEIVRNYDVDGIHFDYIRYPDGEHCYCDGCRARFEAATGEKVANWPQDVLRGGPRNAAYLQFRRDNITALVRAVSKEAHQLKPGIQVSAAVFPSWPACRDDVGQDWGAWVKEGLLDFVCPMDYTASTGEFRTRVEVQREAVAGRVPLYPGIGASAPGLSAAQVIEQVQAARQLGANGFIMFQYDARTAADHIPTMGRATTRDKN